jgi:hypothetical protein
MKHHSFACVHHREFGLEVFSAKFQTRKNSLKYKERQAILRCARFSDQEIIMEKDKTYVKNILDPEFSEDDHSRLYSKKPKSFQMTMRKT